MKLSKHTPLKQKITLTVLGLFLALIIIETGLRIGGFTLLSLQERRNKVSIKEKDEYRIMCLGESTTARGDKDSWPFQLEEILNSGVAGRAIKVINKGVEGVDSGMILSKLEENIHKYNPDAVIAMVGVNDWVGTVLYNDSLVTKIKLFLKDFRVYKLFRIISQNIVNKIDGILLKKMLSDLTKSQNLLKVISMNNKFEALNDRLKNLYFQGKYREVSKILENLMKIIKGDELYNLYIELAISYKPQDRFKETEELFKKAIEIKPEYTRAYSELGIFYWEQKRIKEAIGIFEKGMHGLSVDPGFCVNLGYCYRDDGESKKAEEIFKKALEIDPLYEPAYTELGNLFIEQGRVNEIKELREKIIKEGVKNDRLYGFAGSSYMKEGKYIEAEEYFRKANDFRSEYYNPVTRYNYQKLKEIVIQKGLRLVCVQYPMRNVNPLKKLFESTKGIIFIDSEKIFKDAVKNAKYDDYFTDSFGGDFGHCTRKGNKLLAENIANVILREVLINN